MKTEAEVVNRLIESLRNEAGNWKVERTLVKYFGSFCSYKLSYINHIELLYYVEAASIHIFEPDIKLTQLRNARRLFKVAKVLVDQHIKEENKKEAERKLNIQEKSIERLFLLFK